MVEYEREIGVSMVGTLGNTLLDYKMKCVVIVDSMTLLNEGTHSGLIHGIIAANSFKCSFDCIKITNII